MHKHLLCLFLLLHLSSWAQEDTVNPNRVFADRFFELSTDLEPVDVEASVAALRKSRAYAIKGKLYRLVARAEYDLSNRFDDMGRLDSAEHYLKSAWALTLEHNLEEPFPSMILGNMGNVMAQKGVYDSALYYHEKALESLRPDDQEGVAYGLMNYASVLYYAGQVDRARELYDQALQIGLDSNYQDVVATILQNMVILDSKINGQVSQAQIDTLLNLVHQVNPYNRYGIYQNIASFLLDQGEVEEAKAFLDSLVLPDGSFVQGHEANISLSYAHYLNLVGRHQEALGLLKKLLPGDDLGPQQLSLFRRLALSYAHLGMADSSVRYFDLAWEKREDINEESVRAYIVRSEANIKVIEAYHEKELLKAEISKQRWWLALILMIAILIILTLVLFMRNLRKNRELRESELKHRQARITEMGLKLTQKNELIKELEEKFEDAPKGSSAEFSEWKLALSSHLKKVANTDKDWDNLSQYFEDQYQGFYKKLKAKHPDLSNNELRLCTLARMRMSIKEMAGVLNLSVDSVKSNRYRLRKKMGLSTQTDLSDYLSDF